MKNQVFCYALMLTLALPTAQAAAPDEWVVVTVAGNGQYDAPLGDGGLAAQASLYAPADVTVDAEGNLYIADTWHQRVRKVTPQGIISTLAGNGTAGYSGDGGLATEAQLNHPQALAVDEQGNVFIADLRNYRIRKVDANGIISTYSGTGVRGYSGDDGLAIAAQHDAPYDLAVDSVGNLYVLEKVVSAVRKIDVWGVISTLIGGAPFSDSSIGDGLPAGQAQLWNPEGLALDPYDRLFIADTNNNRIRMIDGGIIYTVAGGGYRGMFASSFMEEGQQAVRAELNMPVAVAVDSSGRLYINDWAWDLIREVDTQGVLNNIAGQLNKTGYAGDGWLALQAQFRYARGLALDSQGHLYVADTANQRIRKLMRSQPPVAAFSFAVENTHAPWQVTLDASSSYDPKGLPLHFIWLDAYGNPLTTAERFNLEMLEAGEHSFTLGLVDALGTRDTLTQTLTLGATEPAPPAAPACAEHALFDAHTSLLHVPAVDMVGSSLGSLPMPVLSADLFWHPRGFFQVMQVAVNGTATDSQCHAQYQVNSSIVRLPYVDIQVPLDELSSETQTYAATLQLDFLHPRYLLLAAQRLN